MDPLENAARQVAEKRQELELRLKQLSEAHPLNKLKAAPLVAATFFELMDHQAAFNAAAIAKIGELEARIRNASSSSLVIR